MNLKSELKLLNNLNLFCFIKKFNIAIKMNISKHFMKRFRLNFTLNQSSQNAEQYTYSTYFGNSLLV
jgi:hypothetical protein